MTMKVSTTKRRMVIPRLFPREKKKKLMSMEDEEYGRQNSQTPLISDSRSSRNKNRNSSKNSPNNMEPLDVRDISAAKTSSIAAAAAATNEKNTANSSHSRSRNRTMHTSSINANARSPPSQRHLQTDGSSAERLHSMLEAVAVQQMGKEEQKPKQEASSSPSHAREKEMKTKTNTITLSHRVRVYSSHHQKDEGGHEKDSRADISTRPTKINPARAHLDPSSVTKSRTVTLAPPARFEQSQGRTSHQRTTARGRRQRHPQRSLKNNASDESSGRKLESILARLTDDEEENVYNSNRNRHEVKNLHSRRGDEVGDGGKTRLHSRADSKKGRKVQEMSARMQMMTPTTPQYSPMCNENGGGCDPPTLFTYASPEQGDGGGGATHGKSKSSAYSPSYPQQHPRLQYEMEDRASKAKNESELQRSLHKSKNTKKNNNNMPIHRDCNGETYILVKCGLPPARSEDFVRSSSNKSISTCSMDSILEDPQRLQMERDRYQNSALLSKLRRSKPPPPPPRGRTTNTNDNAARKKVTFAKSSLADWTHDIRYSMVDAYERWFSCE